MLKMKATITILIMGCATVLAQQPVVVTNVVTAQPSFRIVNGQLYNTEKSILFKNLAGQCIAVFSNGIVVQQMEIQRIYTNVNVEPPELANALGFQPVKRLISEQIVPGKKIFIRHYPDRPLARIGNAITARAMRDGTFNYESETIELWDYGEPNRVFTVKTNIITTNAPSP